MSGTAEEAGAQLDPIDHTGAWTCILYGDPDRGDERALLSFGPDGSTRLARPGQDVSVPWTPLSRWSIENDQLSFSDARSGRHFLAALRRPGLGGEWRTATLYGGWWCTKAGEAVDARLLTEPAGIPIAMTMPLIPEIMATPDYPRQAIREAKEGRAVICFEVDPRGVVHDPHFIELSDEIFRAPSLDALMRSHYQPWTARPGRSTERPACRSFAYSLERITDPFDPFESVEPFDSAEP